MPSIIFRPDFATGSRMPAPLTAVARRSSTGSRRRFSYPCFTTESLWDVSIDTLSRSIAAAAWRHHVVRFTDRSPAPAIASEPTWGALESNTASLRLAARLGFTPWTATSFSRAARGPTSLVATPARAIPDGDGPRRRSRSSTRSVSNTGGFVGPYLLGAINDATHSFTLGLFAIAAMLVTGAVLVLTVGDEATTSS